MTVIRDSPTPIRLNRLGSNPLKHAFGKAVIRCSDVNTMCRMTRGLMTDALSLSVNTSLQIVSTPCQRRSIVVDFEPISEFDPSGLMNSPKVIAVSLLLQTRIDLTHRQFNSNLMQQQRPNFVV
jgi:hypothetical protein